MAQSIPKTDPNIGPKKDDRTKIKTKTTFSDYLKETFGSKSAIGLAISSTVGLILIPLYISYTFREKEAVSEEKPIQQIKKAPTKKDTPTKPSIIWKKINSTSPPPIKNKVPIKEASYSKESKKIKKIRQEVERGGIKTNEELKRRLEEENISLDPAKLKEFQKILQENELLRQAQIPQRATIEDAIRIFNNFQLYIAVPATVALIKTLNLGDYISRRLSSIK